MAGVEGSMQKVHRALWVAHPDVMDLPVYLGCILALDLG